jgi:hypothetical protein
MRCRDKVDKYYLGRGRREVPASLAVTDGTGAHS